MGGKGDKRVFLCYSHDDGELAEQLASRLEDSQIEVWWDKWSISAGDSLRQKVDEGIGDCTHFLALLTSHSIDSEWVKQEMDAAFIRKLRGGCKFIPVRCGLPVGKLPPNLQGIHSPEVKISGKEQKLGIDQLINDINGVSRKPTSSLNLQKVTQNEKVETDYSPAASRVAQLFVERSRNALKFDPTLRMDAIKEVTGLTQEDVEDAYDELASDGFLKPAREVIGWKVTDDHFQLTAHPSLFVEFDRFWKDWNPVDDGIRLATDIINNPDFPTEPKDIAECYNWKPRRLNPAIYYLEGQELVKTYRALQTNPYCVLFIEGNRSRIRRLIKSIS